MKNLKSKCCGTSVRNIGVTGEYAVCNSCNVYCEVVVCIDSGGSSTGGGGTDPNLNIH